MTEKIILKENHKRVISTSLKIIENSIDEILFLISNDSGSFVKVNIEKEIWKINELINLINKIKSKLTELKIKYELETKYYSFEQILNSKKSYLWSVLCDTYSNNLDKYGTFNDSYKREFDNDINSLINMINSL